VKRNKQQKSSMVNARGGLGAILGINSNHLGKSAPNVQRPLYRKVPVLIYNLLSFDYFFINLNCSIFILFISSIFFFFKLNSYAHILMT